MHSPIIHLINPDDTTIKKIMAMSKSQLTTLINSDDKLFDAIPESDYISDSDRGWTLTESLGRNIIIEDTDNPNISKITITKEAMIDYQNQFINDLKQWAKLLDENNDSSKIIFSQMSFKSDLGSNLGSDLTPHRTMRKINPLGGLYLSTFNPHNNQSNIIDGYHTVEAIDTFMFSMADSFFYQNLTEISFFVINFVITDYHY